MNRELPPATTSLAALQHGERGLVVEIDASEPQLGAKFAARGLVPGVEVNVLRGGDPLLLMVEEARWAVTQRDARFVEVARLVNNRRPILRRFWPR